MMATKKAARLPLFVPEAGPPTRAYRSTTIQWSLMSLPVNIYASVDSAQKGGRNSWVMAEDGKSYHPVGVQPFDKTTEKAVDKADVVKGVEVEGKVILISDEELNLTTEYGMSKLLKFVPRNAVYDNPHIVLTNHYQIRPAMQKVGREYRTNQQTEHLFGLLRDRLETNQVVAVLEMTMQDGGAPKMGVLDHHGNLKLMAPQDAIRQQRPLFESEIDPAEAKLIDQLIKKDLAPEVPAFHDQSKTKLNELIQLKLAGKALPTAAPPAETKEGAILGIMDLLEQSLKKG